MVKHKSIKQNSKHQHQPTKCSFFISFRMIILSIQFRVCNKSLCLQTVSSHFFLRKKNSKILRWLFETCLLFFGFEFKLASKRSLQCYCFQVTPELSLSYVRGHRRSNCELCENTPQFFAGFKILNSIMQFADYKIPQSVKLIFKCYSKVNQMPDF